MASVRMWPTGTVGENLYWLAQPDRYGWRRQQVRFSHAMRSAWRSPTGAGPLVGAAANRTGWRRRHAVRSTRRHAVRPGARSVPPRQVDQYRLCPRSLPPLRFEQEPPLTRGRLADGRLTRTPQPGRRRAATQAAAQLPPGGAALHFHRLATSWACAD